MPVSNDVWKRRCDQLLSRLSLFNGRRVCAIVTTHGKSRYTLDPASEVRYHLRGHGFDFIEMRNSNILRETATWDAQWAKLADRADSDDIVFRCHAKGVTKPDKEADQIWGDILFSWLLDYIPAVEAKLAVHPVVGVFQKFGRHFQGSRAMWFYSGSFYWVRLRDTFALRGPSKINRTWYGVETWPGMVWPREVAGCLHEPYLFSESNLYDMTALRGKVVPFFNRWKRENDHFRTNFENAEIYDLDSGSRELGLNKTLLE